MGKARLRSCLVIAVIVCCAPPSLLRAEITRKGSVVFPAERPAATQSTAQPPGGAAGGVPPSQKPDLFLYDIAAARSPGADACDIVKAWIRNKGADLPGHAYDDSAAQGAATVKVTFFDGVGAAETVLVKIDPSRTLRHKTPPAGLPPFEITMKPGFTITDKKKVKTTVKVDAAGKVLEGDELNNQVVEELLCPN